MKKVLSGNEAIALGVYENGVRFASAYPGTPSTEILENFARYEGVYAEWAPNEKVALEAGVGASMAGVRVLVAMKHVGLNVAADPFMTLSYTGINGGFLLVCADDPGMHSSQNEQDNRRYAAFAQVPMLEPADSQESLDMVATAYELSERFDTPVMMRVTTRISHSKGVVSIPERPIAEPSTRGFKRDRRKYVMIPAFARPRHPKILERVDGLTAVAETTNLNRIEIGDTAVGIITSGIAYQYVREVMPAASVLKLGLTYPLPGGLIREFAGKVDRLFVVEELEPYLEEQILAMGLKVEGKAWFPRLGELSQDLVAKGLKEAGVYRPELVTTLPQPEGTDMPRPPLMCAGCSHRGMFYAMNKLKGIVHGDIGCYTLSVLPPLEALDSTLCMGASITMAHGTAKAIEQLDPAEKRPVFAVIGDSTFFHSGLTGLLEVTYNHSNVVICILDNRTTAMTGAQEHPGTGKTLQLSPSVPIDLETVVRALGCERVRKVNPFDLKQTLTVLKEEVDFDGPSVIITDQPCVQLLKGLPHDTYGVDIEVCIGCGMCQKLGCPAISQGAVIPSPHTQKVKRHSVINPTLCNGCALCHQVCKPGAIQKQ
jgi:indolepyruvate ferredoxin oxidoreductase, alpha subunit